MASPRRAPGPSAARRRKAGQGLRICRPLGNRL